MTYLCLASGKVCVIECKSNRFFATAGSSHSQSRKSGVSHITAPETSTEVTSDFPSVTAGV